MNNDAIRVWYKEPWVWLIISLPASAIIAGFYTLLLAVNSYDGLVVDDYYKEGLAINKRLEKEHIANDHQLSADLQSSGQILRIYLNADDEFVYPQSINVLLSHATRQGFDQSITLQRQEANLYQGRFEPLQRGNWNIIIEQDDWRLTTALNY